MKKVVLAVMFGVSLVFAGCSSESTSSLEELTECPCGCGQECMCDEGCECGCG